MAIDLSALMTQTVDGPMSTNITPVPEGDYVARIDDSPEWLVLEEFEGKKESTKGKTFVRGTLYWLILDEGLKASMKRDVIRVRDPGFLDFRPDGSLDNGQDKNVWLGQRRAAFNLNDGQFQISMLKGLGPALIKVKQRADEKNPENKFSEVTRVAPLGR